MPETEFDIARREFAVEILQVLEKCIPDCAWDTAFDALQEYADVEALEYTRLLKLAKAWHARTPVPPKSTDATLGAAIDAALAHAPTK